MGKTKKWKKNFWVTKRGNEELQIGTGFRNYKLDKIDCESGQLSNRGKKIKNRGKKISNRGRDYKWGQGLQISAE